MSKNVIIISSSPRKNGNSDTLCHEFARGATSAGNSAEEVFLRDFKINYCTGCGKCERICPQHLKIREHLKETAAEFEK